MKLSRLLYIVICFLIVNCAGKSFSAANSETSFKNAINLFNKEKYSKARDAFEDMGFNSMLKPTTWNKYMQTFMTIKF